MSPSNPSLVTSTIQSPSAGESPKGGTPNAGASAHPLKVNVGKSFRGVKGSASYLRENEYKVIEFVPLFDFGSGGKKPAYRFERVGVGSVTTRPCVDFLKEFEPWPEAADSTEANEGNEAPKA